jgi:hypothetical protein
MYLKEELAQPVGNAKIRGQFDTDAAMAADQNTNGAGLFQRLDPAPAREEALSLLTQGIAQLLPALETRKHSVALPDTNEVIRRFNRDTEWLATLVVGAVVFAALMLAVLVQDRHPRAVDLTKEAVQAVGDLLPNANSAPTKNPSSQREAAAPTLTPIVASNALAKANTWFPADRRHSMRVIRPKIPNVKYRSSLGLIFVEVKMRLISLWHKTLVRSEKSRISTISSNATH